jgi:hypothetical protein
MFQEQQQLRSAVTFCMVLLNTGGLLLLSVYYYGSSVADQDLVESGIF